MGAAVLLEKREDGFQAYTCSFSVYYATLMNNVISLGVSIELEYATLLIVLTSLIKEL